MEMVKYTNDTSGPTISMSKSRGGAIGTAAAVNDNAEELGHNFYCFFSILAAKNLLKLDFILAPLDKG